MKPIRRILISFLLFGMVACNLLSVAKKPASAPTAQESTSAVQTVPHDTPAPSKLATATTPVEESPSSAGIEWISGTPFKSSPMKKYSPAPYPAGVDALPVDLEKLGNPGVLGGLTDEEKQFLSKNGFVVVPTGDQQFRDIRHSVSTEKGQPYYLTTDAAYHALHITFNDLLITLEQDSLRPVMMRLLKSLYDQVGQYQSSSKGTGLDSDTQLARAYLAVSIKLFNPEATLDPAMEALIAPQLQQIKAMAGKDNSALIPGFVDDYGAYRPVGHYTASPELESYFQGMTWFGRVAFKFQDTENPALKPSRAPLLITLALRDAKVDDQPAYKVWGNIYETIDFMIGPSDDPGPAELSALMEKIYGSKPDLSAVADNTKWQTFLARVNELPAPKINSTFARTSQGVTSERSWRFMGQRYTLDGFIFQNLVIDKVAERGFPNGLDIPAAFGSTQALSALQAAGETKYGGYMDQMAKMQALVKSQPEPEWLNRFYSSWLYAFLPQAAPKDASFPPYMQTTAWGYQDASSLLGSWAELKHDTVLYAKMPEGLGGGGPPMSGPPPAYVEPNPDVFYRLAYAAKTLSDGLTDLTGGWNQMGWVPPSDDSIQIGFTTYLNNLGHLADTLNRFGDDAALELQGKTLSQEEYGDIQSCLEMKECLQHGAETPDASKADPIPVVAAVAGYRDEVLEAGVGYLNRIYVAVPFDGKLEIAQGGVFSYYEVKQPRSDRLTDEAWREKLVNNPPVSPAWTNQFTIPGGKAHDVLAFRIGDIYSLTENGYSPPLNMRAKPSKSAAIVKKFDNEFYLEIIDGPVKGPDGTWWKVREAMDFGSGQAEGWVLENPDWYKRSYSPY
jgi:hypothetical protein